MGSAAPCEDLTVPAIHGDQAELALLSIPLTLPGRATRGAWPVTRPWAERTRLQLAHDEHGAVRVMDDLVGHAPEQEAREVR